jgi:flagellar hook-length control protein FliK
MTDASQVYKTAAQSFVSTAAAVPVNKSGFSEAVMQKVMWMSSQQINRAEISLDPPELGSLQVRVSSHGDQTSVVFSSQHGSVRDALDQNLPRLREMLEQQGLNLADVNVAHQGAEQQQRSDSDSSSSVADSRASNQLDDNVEQLDSKPVESLPKTLSLVDHYV